jgi:hypothetical protein
MAALALVAAGGAIAGYFFTRPTKPQSPRVLNNPTDARRIREIRPGAQPGFPVPTLTREEHSG